MKAHNLRLRNEFLDGSIFESLPETQFSPPTGDANRIMNVWKAFYYLLAVEFKELCNKQLKLHSQWP